EEGMGDDARDLDREDVREAVVGPTETTGAGEGRDDLVEETVGEGGGVCGGRREVGVRRLGGEGEADRSGDVLRAAAQAVLLAAAGLQRAEFGGAREGEEADPPRAVQLVGGD